LALMDTHPGPYNFVPVVSVLGPCGEACPEGQFACSEDMTCYPDFDSFCRGCEGRAADECACRTEAGMLADGARCEFFVSGDNILAGRCRSGVCDSGR